VREVVLAEDSHLVGDCKARYISCCVKGEALHRLTSIIIPAGREVNFANPGHMCYNARDGTPTVMFLVEGMMAMTPCIRKVIILAVIAFSSLAGSVQAAPAPGSEALDRPITVQLRDASMAEAAAAIANVGEVQVAAPAEPGNGISLSMDQQPIREVLEVLAKAVGMKWDTVDGIIVFRKPADTAKTEPEPPKTDIPLTPDQGMAALLASLDPLQLFRLSGGFPLPYGELTPYQQAVLRRMLSPPTAGFTDSGEAISLPAPEEIGISFCTMPYLVIPDSDGKKPISLRLDSTEYITLRKAAEE